MLGNPGLERYRLYPLVVQLSQISFACEKNSEPPRKLLEMTALALEQYATTIEYDSKLWIPSDDNSGTLFNMISTLVDMIVEKVNSMINMKNPWTGVFSDFLSIPDIVSDSCEPQKIMPALQPIQEVDKVIKAMPKIPGPQIIEWESTKREELLNHKKTKKIKQRLNHPKKLTKIMMDWLNNHLDYPYPDLETKLYFVQETGLTVGQINNWFINSIIFNR